MNTTLFLIVVVCMIACTIAFNAPKASKPARMTMFFGGAKKAPATPPATPASKSVSKTASSSKATATTTTTGQKFSANSGSYVPDGLTAAQYQATLKAEADKKALKQKKFPKGKTTESLSEWFEKTVDEFGEGKAARKGHRIVKLKYEEGYADDPSFI